MSNGLSGISSIAYQGTNARTPPNITTHKNRPTPQFWQEYQIGDFWVYAPVNTSNNNELWVLMGKAANVANWVLIGGGTGSILYLHTDDGNNVSPTLGIINIHAGTGIATTGTNGPNTVTISTSGAVATSYITNPPTSTAVPAAGVLTFAGTGGAVISASGSTVTIDAGAGDAADSFPTDSGTATPLAGVLEIKAGVSTLNCGSSVEFTGSSNTVLLNVTDINSNTVIGKNAGSAFTGTESYNTILGAGNAGASGLRNTISIGSGSLGGNVDANVFIGNRAGVAYVPGGLGLNVGLGTLSLSSLTSGYYNVCAGFNSGTSIVSSQGNVLMGHEAGNLVIGSANTGVGYEVFWDSTGPTGLTSGTLNIALGYTAGSKWTSSESHNIAIGTNGVAGESAVTRLGAFNMGETPQTKCFIQGISGITPTNPNPLPVVIDSAGQLGTNVGGNPFYSTGTWKPTLQFGSASVGITYSSQQGQYTRIGNLVYISCYVVITSKGSSTGVATIAGLPFTCSSASLANALSFQIAFSTFDSGYTWGLSTILDGVNYINMNEQGSGKDSFTMKDTNFTNTTGLSISGCYTGA